MLQRIHVSLAATAVFALLGSSACAQSPDWTRFRGPNGSGITAATAIPTEFGKDKNLVWRLDLPQGHSSPILWKDRIYLTAFRDDVLSTFAIDRHAGEILWEREAPSVTPVVVDPRNNPASPSPAVEDDAIYSFFPDYGLIAYDDEGNERWTLPLGPFNNIYGMGASPVIVGDLLLLACDQSTGSFLLALDKRTGEEQWRTMRPEAKSGHATPILWEAPDGEQQILLPGSFLMTAYAVETGERRWWVRGLSFEIKSTPVIHRDTMFINGYGAPVNDPGNKITVPPHEDVWPEADADGNGTLSQGDFPNFCAAFWFTVADLDTDGEITTDEWEYYRAALDSENGMLAIRLGGSGDMTESSVKWKYQRAVPQLPSPLVYGDVLYMVNDGGIVTTLDPETGERLNQGRLTGALGAYYASPVAADGHVYFTSELGAVAVLEPTGELTPMVVNDLEEDTYATPAFADGRIYIRTVEALYAFGR
jgi:outer membrane protein assembly factor BamB